MLSGSTTAAALGFTPLFIAEYLFPYEESLTFLPVVALAFQRSLAGRGLRLQHRVAQRTKE